MFDKILKNSCKGYIYINVLKDFSYYPGAGKISESEKSGEEFFKKILEPKFLEARSIKSCLYIDMSYTNGFGTSFLIYSFGMLALKYGNIWNELKIIAIDENYIIQEIKEIIVFFSEFYQKNINFEEIYTYFIDYY